MSWSRRRAGHSLEYRSEAGTRARVLKYVGGMAVGGMALSNAAAVGAAAAVTDGTGGTILIWGGVVAGLDIISGTFTCWMLNRILTHEIRLAELDIAKDELDRQHGSDVWAEPKK